MHTSRIVLCAAALLGSTLAQAQEIQRQDPAAIRHAVEDFMRVQTAGLPGTVTYTLGAIDPRLALPACPALEVAMPAGARLWGASSVAVRCSGAAPWSLYVTVQVKVTGEYLVAARPLSQGQTLSAGDYAIQSGDLTALPSATVTSQQQAQGRTLASGVPAGQPLRLDMLRLPMVVLQGQSVQLRSAGSGFRVSAEGKALNNAGEGQVAQVRTASGQTVSGIARAGGVIEVRF